jgi:predicted nucleic acid-binding protein
MMVVYTSVWVDYFNGLVTPHTDMLDAALGRQEILIGDLILTEVLQGFRAEADFAQARQLFQAFAVVTMLGPALAVRSAEHYRVLRTRGVTVRKTIDVMIGTYCIAHNLPLLYVDRDFDPMVLYLGLRAVVI